MAQMFVDEWWQLPPVCLECALSEVTGGPDGGGDSHFKDESSAPGVLQSCGDSPNPNRYSKSDDEMVETRRP